ncbi:hypothetical protein [Flavobacterium sp.]|uniref:hypothetical protein n=1 Tax=Flavobacterium sp. TaxID=239 RepID=UPI00286D63A2|nr:hypothetical protein [Flavobacterium sp.]
MDKRIFQLRNGLYKQIIFLFFITFNLFSQKQYVTPVFENNKRIGYYLEETKENCDSCYYFISKNILNKKVTFQLPLTIKEREGKLFFDALYQIVISNYSKNTKIIQFNSTVTGAFYRIYVSVIQGKLTIVKNATWSNSSYSNGDEIFSASYVCLNKTKKTINDILIFDNLFKFKKEECYYFPSKYLLEECMILIKSKQKIKWE